MRQILVGLTSAVVLTVIAGAQGTPRDRQAAGQPARDGTAQASKPTGVMLGDLSWIEAEKALAESTVVVIPLGIATVEHGPHLKLDSKERLARYLAARVQASTSVVIAPPLTYHYSPAYLEYPGSTSVSRNTARDMTVDIVRSLAKYGPRRFYVLNTATSTALPLRDAATVVADDGILLGYTDVSYRLLNVAVRRDQVPVKGTPHAEEAETSMMLFVDPSAVDMSKAVKEYGAGTGALTRKKDAPQGTFSASGVLGDAKVATREKGQALVEGLLAGALEDIEQMRAAPLPVARPRPIVPPPPPPLARPAQPQEGGDRSINGCTPQEDRAIRLVAVKFSSYWRQLDAFDLSLLFTLNGDIRHPDGTIERGQVMIRQNREELFRKREYRGSTHTVTLNDIRCLTPTIAIADGKWELRLIDPGNTSAPGRGLTADRYNTGWCTLVMVGSGGEWGIEAWRYTVDPANGVPPPTTLKQPGFIRGGGG
jgi:creatinine amidohydrolase